MSFINKLLRRENSKDSEEVSYYKDVPTTNKFAAILFGFFALFVTLLIAGGIFFGGRAVYRALNGSSTEETSSNENKQGSAPEQKPEAQTAPSSNTSQQTPQSQSPNNTSSQAEMPSTGDSESTTLPRTGDEGL